VRICHISTFDVRGGAAKAAYRIHSGLRRTGVKSTMLVGLKESDDPDVHSVRQDDSFSDRLHGFLRKKLISHEFALYSDTVSPTLELFSDARVARPKRLVSSLPDADVYNLHWISGLLDYGIFFNAIGHNAPIVWDLPDMYPFTGGCHYSMGCEKFVERCGACPQLGSSNESDLAARNYARKRYVLYRRRPEATRLVTPSRWMAAEVARSSLLGRFETSVIPYALDTEVFQPRDRYSAREIFGLPHGQKIIMSVADSLEKYRKGLDLLVTALSSFQNRSDLMFVSVGHGSLKNYRGPQHFSLGPINSERLLSFAYSAADIFVAPARQEAFGQVLVEAMACGIPAIAFNVGGFSDIIRNNQTGLLVSGGDVGQLAQAISTLVDDDDMRARMSAKSRCIVIEEYGLERQANQYKSVYEQLIASCARSY
jgi:glycosyltransferase involved in cell wall biosynthesis